MTIRLRSTVAAFLLVLSCGGDSGWEPARLTDEAPWVVRLTFSGHRACTAMVLSEHWLLTAGHCAEEATDDLVEVSQDIFGEREVIYRGTAMRLVHPDYTSPPSMQHRWNDAALVGLLEGALEVEDRARLAGLPQAPERMDGWRDPFFAIGYGQLPDPNTGECAGDLGAKKRYDGFALVDIAGPFLGELLTVDLEGRRDALCAGDSGAPVMYAVDRVPHVFAIFSGASFLRTTFYCTLTAPKVDWIETATGTTFAPLSCPAFGDRVWECFE